MRRSRLITLRTGLAAALLAVPLATAAADGPPLALSSASTNAAWKEGWLKPGAEVSFAGSVAAPSTLQAVLRPISRAGVVTSRETFDVSEAGAFDLSFKLPARPLPGR